MSTEISEEDLLAYVDGQLDVARRVAVEAYLQENPELAARVMQDMRQRDEIRLFLMGEEPAGAETAPAPLPNAATSVIPIPSPASRPILRRAHPSLRAAVAAVLFIGIGWSAHELFGNVLADPAAAAHAVPTFAHEAAEAYRKTSAPGPALASRPPEEITHLARLASQPTGGTLAIPTFPEALKPLATRILPWDGRAAVQVDYTTVDARRVTLFAAEDARFAVSALEVASIEGTSVAYWRQGHHVYALAGDVPFADLLSFAEAAHFPWLGAFLSQ